VSTGTKDKIVGRKGEAETVDYRGHMTVRGGSKNLSSRTAQTAALYPKQKAWRNMCENLVISK
jgi:hypothetical protein